jgi:hypothetical protein
MPGSVRGSFIRRASAGHYHVEILLLKSFHQKRGVGGSVRIVSVHKKENLGLDIGEHSAYNRTFTGARFAPHLGAGFQSRTERTVRRIIVVYPNSCAGKALLKTFDHTGYGRFFILAGNQYSNMNIIIHSFLSS